jgi:glycosyltransferase involved in cell wall biosynthesis
MTEINVLRQYPAASHDAPIREIARREGHHIRRHEYDLTSNLEGLLGNVSFLTRSLFWTENEPVVLGAEPFDPIVPLFHRLARRHRVVLHTSWPYWEGDFVPQPARFEWQRDRWKRFLRDVTVVGVTRAATESVATAGASRAVHIPHGVDTKTYRPDAGTIGRDEPVVLFVGRLESRKGIDDLVGVIQNWEGPETRFWFVGEGPRSETVARLATDVDTVEYFGFVSETTRLANIYASADVFTLPSYRVEGWEELFGIVVIEALSSGLPVVATDCVGPSEIIEDGETGHLVGQRDQPALRHRLEELVASDDRREAMGLRAREVAIEQYDQERVANQWRSVLDL